MIGFWLFKRSSVSRYTSQRSIGATTLWQKAPGLQIIAGPQRYDAPVADEIVEVVITGPDAEWLAAFTSALVGERLCACGHVIPAIRSIYRWQGEVHNEAEARVALDTREALVPRIVERVRAEHPYEVPCVIALPIADGDPDYLAWVRTETEETSGAG